jgi:hypothetical protein
MKLEDILENWSKDALYDDLNLDRDSLAISSLHAKYIQILAIERSLLRSCMAKKKGLYKDLREYYLGTLNNNEDLERIGREPFLHKVLKNEVHNYVDSDGELMKLDNRISMQEEKVETLLEIVKAIHKRSFDIKHAIEWRKFTQGF